MTAADFQQRLSAWMASNDDLAQPALALLTGAAGGRMTMEESLDLLAIGFAAGYLQRCRDAAHETALSMATTGALQ